jgi:uncharacterized protein YkwD
MHNSHDNPRPDLIHNGWYYRGHDGPHEFVRGPFSRRQMLAMLKTGAIDRTTLIRWGNGVWHEAGYYLADPVKSSSVNRRFPAISVFIACVVLLLVAYGAITSFRGTSYQLTGDQGAAAEGKGALARGDKEKRYPGQEDLSPDRIFVLTNRVRASHGLPELAENPVLKAIAEERITDMLEHDYFDHVSPTGKQVSDTAQQLGYRYRFIAENIAHGFFLTNQKVLDGWMQSPGHRRNILSPEPTEMGTAIRKGRIKGSETYLGVQIFGRQSPEIPGAGQRDDIRKNRCIPPSQSLLDRIEREKTGASELDGIIEKLDEELTDEKGEIEGFSRFPARSKAESAEQSAFIAAHNQKVKKRNDMPGVVRARRSVLQKMIDEYNERVKEYNQCLKGNT